jgi:hypothetical protein
VIRGAAGYCGGATNRGIQLDGNIAELTLRDLVLESNIKAAVYAVGVTGILVMENCYTEDNNVGLGDSGVCTLDGVTVKIRGNHFHESAGRVAVHLDNCKNSVVSENDGLLWQGIVTTANTQCHFRDNNDVNGLDAEPIYRALLGQITAEDVGHGGMRFVVNPTDESMLAPGTINYCLQSAGLSTATWNSAAGANTDVAPDGTTTADTLTITSDYTPNMVQTGIVLPAGTAYLSFFIKKGTSDIGFVQLTDTTAAVDRQLCTIAWTTGVPRFDSASLPGIKFKSVLCPNTGGLWYRMAFSAPGIVAGHSHSIAVSGNGTGSAGTTKFWGFDLKVGNGPGRHIPTTTLPGWAA